MRSPYVINTDIDTKYAIDGSKVINDSTEVELTVATIQVDVTLYNLSDGTTNTENVTMTREANTGFYLINIADISSMLTDRRSFAGKITENGSSNNMRAFRIGPLSVDRDRMEQVWVHLPYRVNITGGQAWIEWHEDVTYTSMVFRARAYEGGTGTTDATLPERVTHRGPIEVP